MNREKALKGLERIENNNDRTLSKADELVKVIDSYAKDLVDSKKPLLIEVRKLNQKTMELEEIICEFVDKAGILYKEATKLEKYKAWFLYGIILAVILGSITLILFLR